MMELPLVQCKKCKHLEKITNEYLCPFDWCENVLDSPDRDLQRRCKHYQAATKADRIRAMSDEELAGWLERIRLCCSTDLCGRNCPFAEVCYSSAEAPKETLDWLRQEGK